jgi:hypothetical protein
MAHGDAWEEKWSENKRMEWVTTKRPMTAEHRLAWAVQTLQADVHRSPASSRLYWCPCRFKSTCPFRRKTKSSFCACAITFQMQSIKYVDQFRCSNTNKPFTLDKGLIGHKYINSFLWWHWQLTVISKWHNMNEVRNLIPPLTVPLTSNMNTEIWWYSDWVLHSIKIV